mgnify:CR=1 FL=1
MFDLTGKTALVTGASGGIGEAVARALRSAEATIRAHRKRDAATAKSPTASSASSSAGGGGAAAPGFVHDVAFVFGVNQM